LNYRSETLKAEKPGSFYVKPPPGTPDANQKLIPESPAKDIRYETELILFHCDSYLL
jgi:hypothetical protein